MGAILPGYEHKEIFQFSDIWTIEITYGIKDSRFPETEGFNYMERSDSILKKVILFNKNTIITESIEKNPNYLTSKEADEIEAEGKIIGDDFE